MGMRGPGLRPRDSRVSWETTLVRPFLPVLTTLLLLGPPAAAAGTDAVETGRALYAKACAHCHGRTALGTSSYPRLAGKAADYLIDRLTRYRAGERSGPNSPLMIPAARDLSDAEIEALAAFLSGLPD